MNLIILICFIQLDVIATQTGSNKGTSFVVSFIDSGRQDQFFRIIMVADQSTNVAATAPAINYNKQITVAAGKTEMITVENNIGHQGTELQQKYFLITSDNAIAVYGVTFVVGRDYLSLAGLYTTTISDAFLVYPIDTLGKDYYIASWSGESSFLITATQNNTAIHIQIASDSQATINFRGVLYSNGSTLSISMNRFDTFSAFTQDDYTGTHISADKPIAVFSGGAHEERYTIDIMYEQMVPTLYWGSDFVTVAKPQCTTENIYRIISCERNTQIEIAGIPQVTLNKPGNFYEFTANNNLYIHTTKPTALVFYTDMCSSFIGDASMVLLPPITSFDSATYFPTNLIKYYNLYAYSSFMTIVIKADEKDGIFLDDNLLVTSWLNINGNSDMKLAIVKATKDHHKLSHGNPNASFLTVITGRTKELIHNEFAGSTTITFITGSKLTERNDTQSHSTDPCDNYKIMAEGKRATGYKLSGSDVAISDDRLEPGWYKIVNEGGTEIPTEAPGIMSCGTLYPIWLKGDLPTENITEVSQSVCVQTFSKECQQSWNIDIKHCYGNFIIYNLVESQLSSSAYCFGKEVKCPDGQYSENGFTPGCTSDVPKEIFSPVVRAELAEGTIHQTSFGPSLEPIFRCTFDAFPEKSYAYDIYWFINNQSIIVHKKISYSNLNDTLLRPTDWINDYKMNMIVRCSLRVRLDVDSVPGPTFASLDFEAGVKPEFTVYEVAEGEEVSVRFTSSVPIGCVGSADYIKPFCVETLKIAQPEYQDNPPDNCVNNIRKGSTVFETQDCGVTFSTANWMYQVNLTVQGYIDNYYNSDNRKSYIRLTKESRSVTDLSGVWDTINIPEVQVIVSDKDSKLTGRYCGTWNDPRYVTADGKYFTYHGCGEHVLYRNKQYPYWVHTLSTRCWRRGTCNCGIAIRSHDSLFVVRTCDTISTVFYSRRRHHPYISYTACDDEHMTIQKLKGGYKVTLPIGTEISFTVSSGWIPGIFIKPSTLDIDQTEGLCGFVSKTKDTSDDFIPRGSSFVASSVYDFARSWSVGRYSAFSGESLFTPFPMFPSNDLQLKEYCLCAAEANHNDDISKFTDIHCNLTQPLRQCETAKSNIANRLYQECHTQRMRRDTSDMKNDRRKIIKRNALDNDDLIDETSLTYHETFDPNYLPSDPDWKNGWNEDSARDRCEVGISEMAALELCQKYANTDKALYIGLCIEDIKISGSSDYIPYMIWLMEEACKSEISRNESLFSNSSGNNGLSVMETIFDLMCPNSCSNNGVCNKSECVCNNGYIGFDCSMTLADAPKEISVPDEGLCGTKQRNCKKTNIFGEFHASNVYCKLEHFIVTDNGKQLTSTESIAPAVYSYENLISCEFPSSRKRRSTNNRPEGYDISLSFDQTNYGDTVSVIIYDDDCFNCNSTSVTCTELDLCLGFTTVTEYGTSTVGTTEIKTTNDQGQTYDMNTNIERTTTTDASHVTNSLTSAIENDSTTHPASEISNHATTTTKEMIEPTTETSTEEITQIMTITDKTTTYKIATSTERGTTAVERTSAIELTPTASGNAVTATNANDIAITSLGNPAIDTSTSKITTQASKTAMTSQDETTTSTTAINAKSTVTKQSTTIDNYASTTASNTLNLSESKASGVSPGIYGAIAGALLLVIIVAAVVIYKYGFRKPNGRSSILVDSNESTLNANKSGSKGTAQTATICPQQYTRESSHLSISWSESSRPSTPANLFLAKADK